MGDDFSPKELARYWSIARRIALRWCALEVDANDAAQEVILRLLRQKSRPARDIAWLYVVTRRVCNRMRLAACQRHHAEHSYADASIGAARDHDLPIDVGRILDVLPPRDRLILQLVADGVAAREIAAILGCKTRDVGQLVARARRRARRLRDARNECLRGGTPS